MAKVGRLRFIRRVAAAAGVSEAQGGGHQAQVVFGHRLSHGRDDGAGQAASPLQGEAQIGGSRGHVVGAQLGMGGVLDPEDLPGAAQLGQVEATVGVGHGGAAALGLVPPGRQAGVGGGGPHPVLAAGGDPVLSGRQSPEGEPAAGAGVGTGDGMDPTAVTSVEQDRRRGAARLAARPPRAARSPAGG
jgi:hypothetical protein